MPTDQGNTQQVLTSKAQTLSVKLFEQIWNKVHEHYSLKYNAKEVEKIEELSRIYKFCGLADHPPESWKVENGIPKYVAIRQDWFMLVEEWEVKCGSKVSYKELIINIASVCANYMDSRQKRVIASGKHGDSVSQFFSEIMYFVMNLLMSYTAKEMIEVLQKRIHYLDMVLKSPKVICYGSLTRKSNKVDAVTEINRLFKLCLNKAKDEINLESARENIQAVKHSIESVLNDIARIVYYAREDSTASIFILDKHALVNASYSSGVQSNRGQWFDQLKSTATGQLLLEFISLSGSKAFGYSQQDEFRMSPRVYFGYNQNNALEILNKYFDFVKTHALDLPVWVGRFDDKIEYIQKLTFIVASGIRLSLLHQCICDAHMLAGHGGDLWAYGDGDGKFLLNQLINMVTNEKMHLQPMVAEFDENNERLINYYNEKKRWSYDKRWNPNFRKVHRAAVNISKRLFELANHTDNLKKGMKYFPNNFGKIQYLKDKFFKDVNQLHYLYYNTDNSENIVCPMIEWPIDERLHYITQDDVTMFIRTYSELKQKVLGGKRWYHFSWTSNGKVNRFYDQLDECSIANKLKDSLNRLSCVNSKTSAYEVLISLNDCIDTYSNNLKLFNYLMPRWRCKPFRYEFSLGWPFGRSRKKVIEASKLANQQIMTKLVKQFLSHFQDNKQLSCYQSSSDLLIETLHTIKKVFEFKGREIDILKDKLSNKGQVDSCCIKEQSDQASIATLDSVVVTKFELGDRLSLTSYNELPPCLLFGVFSAAYNHVDSDFFTNLLARCEDLLDSCLTYCMGDEKVEGLAELYLQDYIENYQQLIDAVLQDSTLTCNGQFDYFNLNMEKFISCCTKANLVFPHEDRSILINLYEENHCIFRDQLQSVDLIL